MKYIRLLSIIAFLFWNVAIAQQTKRKKIPKVKPTIASTTSAKQFRQILPGAYLLGSFVPKLKSKRVAVFANHTSMVGNTHLVDTLTKLGVTIVKIFAPEHGFRGTANAGEKVDNYKDEATGIPVVSLYGKKTKPMAEDLSDVDVLVFDIQDVGVRFYTYISSLQDLMEAALQNNKLLYILDRPNPNGFYVDGPVLDTAFKSFIGMQAVPVVYGLTIGEYAKLLIGEKLLQVNSLATASNIIIVKCRNYSHKSKYILPVKPSPNLPGMGSVYWYPSTCFFEGTVLSEGRGTDKPFEIFGHPSLPSNMYAFIPVANAGASSPKLKNKQCYGWNVSGTNEQVLQEVNNHIQLRYLLNAYKLFPDKDSFFIRPTKKEAQLTNYFFNKLAGNATLMQQIVAGKSEKEIRASWQPKLKEFKKKRKKYLLYDDFE